MKIICPRCSQGWVKKVFIGACQKIVFHCYECEATWFCEGSIEAATFLDLSTYLSRKNIEPSSATYATFEDDDSWLGYPES